MQDPTNSIPDGETPHILVVDDDDRIRDLLGRFLSENGFRASMAGDAEKARSLMAGVEFDLLIIDVMMPGLSGFEMTEQVRAASNVPILLLTARGETADRIEGFERGADDYLPKPFDPQELLVRLRALLRRAQPRAKAQEVLTFGECRFEPTRGELRRGDTLIKLTSGELSLLRALSKKPGEPISRSALTEQTEVAMERSIDVQVTRLRKKIEDDPHTPLYLQTIRGVGYALMPD